MNSENDSLSTMLTVMEKGRIGDGYIILSSKIEPDNSVDDSHLIQFREL